ncbi:nucleotidyltransferase family protein [Aliiglaciecola sp. CAU 1673]|uniref:nucleotidyltransferase domain-containing protein n=1 Tax=Aliiglaciecola sp. CAU 1673 TaxID=3032595 RepID=UPI0023DA9D0D|nr:nucleotidyltransferase family protein [Aliiglaciecola sp. CAU 1673]MDF2177328.1 nucleotidyltransferase family protein [Aliiglaciecola sp. CAU 1673]
MRAEVSLIIEVLKYPESVLEYNSTDWQIILSQGYRHRLLGRLFCLLSDKQLNDHIPEALRWHFQSMQHLSLAHSRDMHIEKLKIEKALKMVGVQPVFLKGLAYDLAKDASSKGRLYADVDIYIPREQIPAAEHALKLNGWFQEEMADYDVAYYRNWMHEIPPLVHKERAVTLDVHHHLLPLTCRFAFSVDKLNLSKAGGHLVLDRDDRILHSACHLFMETEFNKGLRDLSDLDLMFRQHAGADENFWFSITSRADELGLGRLFFYALRYCHQILGTPVPQQILEKCHRQWAPSFGLSVLDWLFTKVLTEPVNANSRFALRSAHYLMFIRGHWLKMPLHILLYHSLHKGWKGFMSMLQRSENVKE